ncbi:hypothetical protein ACQU0X_26940 [Pseudovibrio ascidiaceicola]|uniref:hypothetical protein n=1 Tax=Pseudovibrio ascidiaceicola TaxID=285279 RepID=UPI003D359C58
MSLIGKVAEQGVSASTNVTEPTHRATWIGGDRGGIGKSTVTQVIYLAHEFSGVPCDLTEIDNQKTLTNIMGPERVSTSLPATPNVTEASQNRYHLSSLYNEAYARWAGGDSVTDLGANVTTMLFDWMNYGGVAELAKEDNIRFQFVACASPDYQAIISAHDAIVQAKKTLGDLVKLFVVFNDITGENGFKPYQFDPVYMSILKMQDHGELKAIYLPYCDSCLLEQGRSKRYDLKRIKESASELVREAGIDALSGRMHKHRYILWLSDVQSALDPILNS